MYENDSSVVTTHKTKPDDKLLINTESTSIVYVIMVALTIKDRY